MDEEDIENLQHNERMTEVIGNLSDEEKASLDNYPVPYPEIKHNTHTFLNKVLETKDTTKVGFLMDDEMGKPHHPIRAYKELALISGKIIENPLMEAYFLAEGENTLATSLSRNGKLINLAVIQKRIVADESKPRAANKAWFKKKESKEDDEFSKV